jgi:hypothetical protein
MAATYVRPRGAFYRAATLTFGFVGYLLRRRVPKSPLPEVMLLALDHVNLYLFTAELFDKPHEMGRWRQGTYRAVAAGSGFIRTLSLELEGLGQVELELGTAWAGRASLPVIDLVVGLARSDGVSH